MPDEPDTYAEIDVAEIPFCCPACLVRATWRASEQGPMGGTPAHFLCPSCSAAFPLALMGHLLTPAMMSLHHQ